MNLNHIRALAGLQSKPLAIAVPAAIIEEVKLPEATIIRESLKEDVESITGECMAALLKLKIADSGAVRKAVRASVRDAFEAGRELGYDEGSKQ